MHCHYCYCLYTSKAKAFNEWHDLPTYPESVLSDWIRLRAPSGSPLNSGSVTCSVRLASGCVVCRIGINCTLRVCVCCSMPGGTACSILLLSSHAATSLEKNCESRLCGSCQPFEKNESWSDEPWQAENEPHIERVNEYSESLNALGLDSFQS